MDAIGYAVVSERTGKVLVDTVSPTKRAAMVNFLVVYARMIVTNGCSDEAIKQWFAESSEAMGFSLRKAVIRAEKRVEP